MKLKDGKSLDAGHIFTGLDAIFNTCQVVSPYVPIIKIPTNIGVCTWMGELASIPGGIYVERSYALKNAPRRFSEIMELEKSKDFWQEFVNKYASPADMLGNVDSLVIGKMINRDNLTEEKVSTILRKYYVENNTYRMKRFSNFAEEIFLYVGQNEDSWIKEYQKELKKAIQLFIFSENKGFGLQAMPSLDAIVNESGAKHILRIFVRAISKLVNRE